MVVVGEAVPRVARSYPPIVDAPQAAFVEGQGVSGCIARADDAVVAMNQDPQSDGWGKEPPRGYEPEPGENRDQDEYTEGSQPALAEPQVCRHESGMGRSARLESRAVLVGGRVGHALIVARMPGVRAGSDPGQDGVGAGSERGQTPVTMGLKFEICYSTKCK